MFKKKYGILIAVLVFALAFTACSDNDDDKAGSGDVVVPEYTDVNETGKADGFKNFETVGLDGIMYNQDYFAMNKLTMVNIWGTYCGPCLTELPYLGELSRDYEESDIRIVGLLTDVQNRDYSLDENMIETAISIVTEKDATYTHLLLSKNLEEGIMKELSITAIPTTLFVDSNGELVGDPVIGSKSKDEWKKIIEERYAEVK